jgi:hypothetical protein
LFPNRHEVALVALSVPRSINEGDDMLTGPDMWAEGHAGQTHLFVELAVQRNVVALARIEASARQCPDSGGRELESNE